MGLIKEQWGKQLEEIEGCMDAITVHYGEILPLGDYLDHLLDFWTKDYLEDFAAGIVEYHDHLLFLAETDF